MYRYWVTSSFMSAGNNNNSTQRLTYSKVSSMNLPEKGSLSKQIISKIKSAVDTIPKNSIHIRLTIDAPLENAKNMMANTSIENAKEILLQVFPFTKEEDYKSISKRPRCFLTKISERYSQFLKNPVYTIKFNMVNFYITVSKYENKQISTFKNVKPTPKPAFKLHLYGYTGDPKDIVPIINLIGKPIYVNHRYEKKIYNSRTDVGYSNLNSIEYLKLDKIPIDEFTTIYVSWFKEPSLDLQLFSESNEEMETTNDNSTFPSLNSSQNIIIQTPKPRLNENSNENSNNDNNNNLNNLFNNNNNNNNNFNTNSNNDNINNISSEKSQSEDSSASNSPMQNQDVDTDIDSDSLDELLSDNLVNTIQSPSVVTSANPATPNPRKRKAVLTPSPTEKISKSSVNESPPNIEKTKSHKSITPEKTNTSVTSNKSSKNRMNSSIRNKFFDAFSKVGKSPTQQH